MWRSRLGICAGLGATAAAGCRAMDAGLHIFTGLVHSTHAETPSVTVDTLAVSKTMMYCPSTGSPAALPAHTQHRVASSSKGVATVTVVD